ncbi:transmembrane protein 272-like isoform X2 [Sitophilus oryzae]|uniref:Transmembrane protein 272-like isoform X2 n=1 Tax=Sitophilus oryzae TaxID=7048 RepID=A0A6J2XUY0_SITOR|nr:transmembrane protein 272-like isoform X2 [Sitophilus oryzae]
MMYCSFLVPRIDNPIPAQTQGLRRLCQVVHFVLPVTKLLTGLAYINSCPTNSWLPIYLIVGGVLQLCFLAVLTFKALRQPIMLLLVGFGLVVWGIISSVNIFVEWKPDFFIGGWRYCHKGFFYFCFYSAASEYLIFSLVVIYLCTQFAYQRPGRLMLQQT